MTIVLTPTLVPTSVLPQTDKERLNWIEWHIRETGISITFDYMKGTRLIKGRYVGLPQENIRGAIDHAAGDEYMFHLGISKETVKMPVLCTNCKYSHFSGSDYSCTHPSNISPVDGILEPIPCDGMRSKTGACGPEGRLFTAKEPSVPPMPASSPPGV